MAVYESFSDDSVYFMIFYKDNWHFIEDISRHIMIDGVP